MIVENEFYSMSTYKDQETIVSLKKTSFINLISDTFVDGYDEYQADSAHFIELSDFQAVLNKYFMILMQDNVEEVKKILFSLYQIFLTPNINLTSYCISFHDSMFGLYIFDKIQKEIFLPAAPYFLQLFIEMIFRDRDNFFFSYCINNGILDIIMHFKNSLPNNYYPLLMVFSYNLYSFCSDLIVEDTSEYNRIIREVFLEAKNEEHSFLSILVLINLLRNVKIADQEKNDLFFNFINLISGYDSQIILVSSMWSLYFWFKNSWEYASPYITEQFVIMISENIQHSELEVIVKISLYIYSYLWAVLDDVKKSYVEKNFPLELILSMIRSDVEDIAKLSLVNINNFICEKESNCSEFLSMDGFDKVLETMTSGSTKVKIEAGFVITTALDFIPIESLENYLTANLVQILCEICMIDGTEDFQLIIRILNFFCKILPDYSWIISTFEETGFLGELQSLDKSYLDEIITLFDETVRQITSQAI